MNLKTYIKDVRKITQEVAAKELGISRVHLNNIINLIFPGIKLAKKIETWSNGIIKAQDILNLKN